MNHLPIRDRVRDGIVQRFCKWHEGWADLNDFVRHAQGRRGYLGQCRLCRNDDKRTRFRWTRSTEPEKRAAYNARRMVRYYRLRAAGCSSDQARRRT